ncbi:hypothetical protein ACFOZ0_33860, partial [Streptomyces yaanensis]
MADEPLSDGPVEEVVGVLAGGGAGTEPGIDVVLGALAELASSLTEPVQELDGDGGVLLGSEECAGGHGCRAGLVFQPSRQVPAYVAFKIYGYGNPRPGNDRVLTVSGLQAGWFQSLTVRASVLVSGVRGVPG